MRRPALHSRPAAKAHSRDLSTARLVFQRCIQRVAPRGRRILWVLAALRKSSPVARRACCARSPRPASAAPQHRLFLRLSQRHLQSRGRRQCLRIWVCGRRLFRVCGRRALPLRPAVYASALRRPREHLRRPRPSTTFSSADQKLATQGLHAGWSALLQAALCTCSGFAAAGGSCSFAPAAGSFELHSRRRQLRRLWIARAWP